MFFPIRVRNFLIDRSIDQSIVSLFQEAVTLEANSKIKINFWRCCSSSQVWYEWTMVEPRILPIHNPSGRSFSIGK